MGPTDLDIFRHFACLLIGVSGGFIGSCHMPFRDIMDMYEIEDILTKALGPKVLLGVFLASQLAPGRGKELERLQEKVVPVLSPLHYVDCQHLVGSHWVAMYFDRDSTGRYLDSFGQPPHYGDWINYLTWMSEHRIWEWSKAEVQPMTSKRCGQ